MHGVTTPEEVGVAAPVSSGVVPQLRAVLTVLVYRLALQGRISHLVPGAVATSLAWVLAGTLVLLSAVSIVGELGGVRPE